MSKKQNISKLWERCWWMCWLVLTLVIGLCAPPVPGVQAKPVQSGRAASSEWRALGTGTNGQVHAIAISGTDVYVGGMFSQAGNCVSGCNNIAKWDTLTKTWSALDGGTDGEVLAIAVRGSDVFVGGVFSQAGHCTGGCNNIARLNGLSWSALDSGTDNIVHAIAVNGADVYVGGEFTQAGSCTAVMGCAFLARWSGSTWSALGSGVDSYVKAISVANNIVYVGGMFYSAGGAANTSNLAKWDGSFWHPINGDISDTGIDGEVDAIAVSGSDLYAGGTFAQAGTVPATHLVHWNGSTWSALPTGAVDDGYVRALALDGSNLYVGGEFHAQDNNAPDYIVKWDGSVWSPLGSGMDNDVLAIAVSGSHVYAGGGFNQAGGVSDTNFVADYYSPSSDANLSNLELTSGTLTPQFAPARMIYSAQVGASVSQFSVTPTASDAMAEISVNGEVVASGNPSGNIELLPGNNLITILVTAEDGVTEKTYTLTVWRGALFRIYLPCVMR